jgi:hypothetical protein
LKVDVAAVPGALVEVMKAGHLSLDNPNTTLELLRANAVVGVTGFFDRDGRMKSIGIQCAFCHSTVDDSFATGIGRRLDGGPNRDLNVGTIVAAAPNLTPMADYLGIDEASLRKVLRSWGPGRYDAEINQDGKVRTERRPPWRNADPRGIRACRREPSTYSGWGSVPYWNAYVAITQMHGEGTFFDRRLADARKFPIAARHGVANLRPVNDFVTAKLVPLHFYQMAIRAPEPPPSSYDKAAAQRGEMLFKGKATCARCHVPPLVAEPGWPMHTAAEIGMMTSRLAARLTIAIERPHFADSLREQRVDFITMGRSPISRLSSSTTTE